MKIWERLSNRAILTSAVAVAAMAAVGATALTRTVAVARTVETFTDHHFPETVLLAQIAQGRVDLERATSAAFAAGRVAQLREDLYTEVDLAAMVLDEGVKSYADQGGRTAAKEASWRDVATSLQAYRTQVDAFVAALKERDALAPGAAALDAATAKALAAFQATRTASQAADKSLGAYQTRTGAEVVEAKAESAASTRNAMLGIGVALLIGVLAVIAGGVVLTLSVRRTVSALVAESSSLVQAVSDGNLDVRGRPEVVSSEFRTVVTGMNEVLDAFVRPLRLTAETIDRISRGAIPEKAAGEYRGEFDAILQNLNGCIDAVNALVADARMLSAAAVEGQLATRADPSRHQGDFRKVIEGVNATLDSFAHPLQVAAHAVDQIAHGQMPEPIREEWRGDFTRLRDNLNTCVAAIQGVLEGMGRMTEEQAKGDIDASIDETSFQGSYRQLAAGVNGLVRMHVTNQLKVLEVLSSYAEGDFSPVLEALKGKQRIANERLDLLRANLTAVASEVQQLAGAAVEGQLSARADAARLKGDWRKLAEGVNATLEALAAPVDEATQVLQRLERRDLTARMAGQYRGDHVRIKDALNGTATALHDALAQVADAAEQVQGAAAQIASSSQAVASGASQQASSLEETTSAIESVASGAQRSADNAQQANALAQTARSAASDGASAVSELKSAVGKIRAATEGTSQIIKDVSDIAFQTNLLALNAAVEAARAGEAGRGFAVVAEEVRSLALRAKEAAGKTEELIRQSMRQADEGTTTSDRVTAKLGEIVAGIGKVTDIVSEIAVAAREQSAGITQVTETASELDKLTQQNAASAEESSSAASELSGQAQELASMVSSFQLDHRARGGGRAPADRGGPAPGGRAPALLRGRLQS